MDLYVGVHVVEQVKYVQDNARNDALIELVLQVPLSNNNSIARDTRVAHSLSSASGHALFQTPVPSLSLETQKSKERGGEPQAL